MLASLVNNSSRVLLPNISSSERLVPLSRFISINLLFTAFTATITSIARFAKYRLLLIQHELIAYRIKVMEPVTA